MHVLYNMHAQVNNTIHHMFLKLCTLILPSVTMNVLLYIHTKCVHMYIHLSTDKQLAISLHPILYSYICIFVKLM